MSHETDLSFLDRPEILQTIFPVAYSPFYSIDDSQSSLTEADRYAIEVEPGIKINCAFWASGKENPSLLYFHGNGETAAGYGWLAPYYNLRGMNLFVADYRGYGSSDGKPTISNMIDDSHALFKGFKDILKREGFKESFFLMGRSLGSVPALELAFHHQDEIRGLIIESGAANNFRRLWLSLGITGKKAAEKESLFLNKVKIRQVRKPTLIIHGEYDQIISVIEGQELYENSCSQDKKILIIPGADHNDIMVIAADLYFDTIEKFVKKHG
jgi:alpha-beta hydrolase superfamily lysophospholipase